MNALRRSFAAAALRSLPRSRTALPLASSLHFHPLSATFAANNRPFNSRMLSTAPGTGENAQSSSNSSGTSDDGGSGSSARDDETVKKVGPKRWKWIGMFVVLSGALMPLKRVFV